MVYEKLIEVSWVEWVQLALLLYIAIKPNKQKIHLNGVRTKKVNTYALKSKAAAKSKGIMK